MLTEKLIGDIQINIDGSAIVVQGKCFKGTKGIYVLLIMKNLKDFSEINE